MKTATIETTTRDETWTAIQWAYSTFDGLDNYNINGWNWNRIPGHYDNANGATTYFLLSCINESFGMQRCIDVIQYRAYYRNNDMYKKVILDLIFKAAEIRYKNINQNSESDKKFLNDYKFYTRIQSSINDTSELELIKLELDKIEKEIHWPHFYGSFIAIASLLNIVLNVRRTPCPNDSARPDSASMIIHEIIDFYPVSEETREEFQSYMYSLCDNNSYTEYEEEEEEEALDGYQSGNVNNRLFESLFKNVI